MNPGIIRLAVFVVAGLIVGLYIAKKTSAENKSQFAVAAIFGGLVGFLIGALFSMMMREALPRHYEEAHRIKIFSMRDSSPIEGSFTLGSGSIGMTEYYAYYREWGRGMKKEKVPQANSIIVEGEKSPVLVVLKKKYDRDWYHYLGANPTWCDTGDCNSYEFHVPKGTVITAFRLE